MVETEQDAPYLGDRAKLDEMVERRKQIQQREPVNPQVPTTSATLSTIETFTSKCEKCLGEFTYEGIVVEGRKAFSPKLCRRCAEIARQEREEEQERITLAGKEADWFDLCPPLYRDTDPLRLQLPRETVARVTNWTPNATGIGLAGSSGAGKTRLMFLLLGRIHFEGIRCRAMTAKRFENWCHRMFEKDDDARVNIAAAKSAKVLFIDDIGKEKYTERVESEFYDLIEHRTSHLLPILWTANATGQQLVKMMGEDRGAPIVRRLREFSTIISV